MKYSIGNQLTILALLSLFAAADPTAMSNPFRYLKPQGTRYNNPPVVIHESAEEARVAAKAEALANKGGYYQTAGTPSMEPLMTGKVYAVVGQKPYDQLKEGDISHYKANWSKNGTVIHRLVQNSREGWVGSGDNNQHSEPRSRVTPQNYLGVITTIHTYKGAEDTREPSSRNGARPLASPLKP